MTFSVETKIVKKELTKRWSTNCQSITVVINYEWKITASSFCQGSSVISSTDFVSGCLIDKSDGESDFELPYWTSA